MSNQPKKPKNMMIARTIEMRETAVMTFYSPFSFLFEADSAFIISPAIRKPATGGTNERDPGGRFPPTAVLGISVEAVVASSEENTTLR